MNHAASREAARLATSVSRRPFYPDPGRAVKQADYTAHIDCAAASERPRPLAERDRPRYVLARSKVLAALAELGRPLSRGEITAYILPKLTLVERLEVLTDLIADGRLACRTVDHVNVPCGRSTQYALTTGGRR